MNLLGTIKIMKGEEEVEAKLTLSALYKAQQDLKIKGLIELVMRIQELDLAVIQTLVSHMQNKIKKDEVLDSINLPEMVEFIGTCLAKLMQPAKGNV